MDYRVSKLAVLALSTMIGCGGDADAGGGMGGTAGMGGAGGMGGTGGAAGSDLDLHFAHPFADSGADVDGDGSNDPWFAQPFDVFWFNANLNWGSFDPIVNDDPALTIEDSDGAGPEAIDLEIGENVTYRIGGASFRCSEPWPA